MVAFMEQHTDMAKGYTKGDRVLVASLWRELSEIMNSQGPPQKDPEGWKKVWIDWKSNVRKKLAHNRREATATGGGPFNKFTLSQAEENVARICGLQKGVEGISNSTSIGFGEDMAMFEINENAADGNIEAEYLCPSSEDDNGMPCTSRARSATPNINKRKREPTLQETLKSFMVKQTETHKALTNNLKDLVDIGNQNLIIANENKSSLKRVYRSVEKLCEVLKERNEDQRKHYLQVEKAMNEKNKIKLRQLEIEEIHLQIKKKKENIE